MFERIKTLFRLPSGDELRVRQCEEAERMLATVEVDLEYTIAMRDMYKARLLRLRGLRGASVAKVVQPMVSG